jgi:GAF domain-containing protein
MTDTPGGGALRSELLSSIVGVARAIFLAEASSIAVLDPDGGDFAFAAVAGQGEEIVGLHFPAGQGLAGAVAQTGEPLIIDNLSADTRFARGVAEKTGYVPNAMMVAPLLRDERTLGVLSVLDRGPTGRSALQELDLLGRFADQAAIALDATDPTRTLGSAPSSPGLAAIAAGMTDLPPARRDAAERLLAALDELIAPRPE